MFSDAGIRPARFLFPVWDCLVPSAGIFCSQGGNDFPQMTGKAAALPVAKHKQILSARTHIYWVATAIGVVRSMADL